MRALFVRRGRDSVGSRSGSFLGQLLLLMSSSAVALAPAQAQETITYSYDALGRLVKVDHGTTGPNANVSASYTYDKADNRSQVVVSTGTTTTLALSPTTLPNGTVGTAYSQTITATGGAGGYSFAKTAGTLPAGLALSAAGVLSGSPTTAATSSFTITATDSGGNTGSRAYSIVVGAASVTLTLSPTTLPAGTVGAAYNRTITATGGTAPYTFTKSAGTLPAGLSLTSAGVLSGTPTTAATYSFTIKATDSAANTGTRAYSVTVGAASNPPITANFDNGGSISCGGNSVEINVVANDTGGVPPLSLVSATGATVVSSTDVTVFSGASAGTKSFSYVVQDTVGTQATGSGSVTVTSPCQ